MGFRGHPTWPRPTADLRREHRVSRGYPRDNIIFEDSQTAVTVQNGSEAMRADMSRPRGDNGRAGCFLFSFKGRDPSDRQHGDVPSGHLRHPIDTARVRQPPAPVEPEAK